MQSPDSPTPEASSSPAEGPFVEGVLGSGAGRERPGRFRCCSKFKAVLSLDRDVVEWNEALPDGRLVFGRVSITDPSQVSIVRAALEAREQAGGSTKCFTLALGPTLAPLTRLALPPLKGRELTLVLTRRAAQALGGCALDPRFHALPLEGDPMGEARGEQQVWLMTAFDAAQLNNLVRALGRAGLHCLATSSRILAGFVHAKARLDEVRAEPYQVDLDQLPEEEVPSSVAQPEKSTEPEEIFRSRREAHLTLLVEPSGFSIGLQEGDSLLHVERIAGDLRQEAGVAMAAMQELRSLGSFFRRESRGGRISAVVVVGLEEDALALLSLSIRKVLPEAEIVSSSRAGWLAEAASPGRDHPRLSRRRARWTNTVVGTAVALTLSAVGLTWNVRAHGLEDLSHAHQDLSVLEAEDQRLTQQLALAREVGEDLEQVALRFARLAALGQRDLDLEGILRKVARILDSRARLGGFACRLENDGRTRVEIDAETALSALESHGLLEEIRSGVGALAGVEDLALELPVTFTDRGRGTARGLEFRLAFSIRERLGPGGGQGEEGLAR